MTAGFKRTLVVWFVLMGLFLIVVIAFDKYGERVTSKLQARSKMEQAVDMESEGKIEKAALLYEHAVDSNERDPRYRALLARAYMKIGRFADAQIQAERAVEYSAQEARPDILLVIARVYAVMGSWDRALDILQQVIEQMPTCAEAYYEMAKAAEAVCDYPRMITAFGEVARLGNRDSSPEYTSALERRQRRISALNKQTEAQDASAETYYALGVLYKETGRWRDAVNAFNEALDSQQVGADAYFWLGVDAEAAGRRDQAVAMYERAVALSPSHGAALRNLERSLLLDRIDEYPTDPEAWYNLGLAYSNLKNWKEAQVVLSKTVEIAPDFADAHFRLGRTLEMLGRTEEARAAYVRTVELSPNHPQAAEGLVRVGNRG